MTKETITLSQRELDRVWMMEAVIAKRLRQREAALTEPPLERSRFHATG